MKRLTHIRIDGLKSLERFDLDVPKLLAIKAPNGAGKSAIFSAIKLGVLGHDPDIGKKLEATRKIIRDGAAEAEVALTFADGFAVTRRVGASMETRTMPPGNERLLADHQKRIDRETGSFVLCFDLQAFLGLSKEKRREWLLRELPRAGTTINQALWRQWLGYESGEEFVRKAIDHLWQEKVLADQSQLDGLASAIAYTNEQFLKADRERQHQVHVAQAADGSAIELSERKAPEPEELTKLEAEISAADRRIGELDEQIAAAEKAARRAREVVHEINVAEARAADAGSALSSAQAAADAYDADSDTELVQARLALSSAESAAAASPPPTDEELAAAADAYTRSERKGRSQRDAVKYSTGQLATARAAFLAARNHLEQLRNHATCPTCGSTEIVGAAARVEASIPELEAELRKAEEWRALAEKTQDEIDVQTSRLKTELARLTERRDAAAHAESAVASARAALERAQERATERERRLFAGVERARENLTRTEEELGRLRVIEAGPQVADTDAAEEERDGVSANLMGLRDRMRKLRAALKDAGKAEAERERADKERRTLDRLTARADALKTLYQAQQRLRAHVIRELVGPVEARANELLQTIDPQKTFRFLFEREGRDDFDMGFEQDGAFRSYDAASNGERAFLGIVFVAAMIAACSPAWPALLVDNVESVDDILGRRRFLMLALAKMQERFGNVVLSGCCDFAEVEGWTVVELDAPVTAEAEAAA